jgi:hypothetical protein
MHLSHAVLNLSQPSFCGVMHVDSKPASKLPQPSRSHQHTDIHGRFSTCASGMSWHCLVTRAHGKEEVGRWDCATRDNEVWKV